MYANPLVTLQAILSHFQKCQSTKLKREEHMNAIITPREKTIHVTMQLKFLKNECQSQ